MAWPAAMSHYAFCGLSRDHLGELVTELPPLGYPAGVIPIPGDRPRPAGRRFFATSQAAETDLYRGERERAGRVRGKHHPSRNCAARWRTLTLTVAARLTSPSKRADGTRRRFGPRDGNVLTWAGP